MAVNFELDDLQAFRAVAEMKSFSKAAEAVHISQPAFSRRIEKLESALGVRLLDRNTRRVTLTAVGRDFARKVEHLLDELDASLLEVRGVATSRMAEVAIACVHSTVRYFVTGVLGRFHAAFPKIRVRVLDGSANEVLAAVAGGQASFGIDFIGASEPEIRFRLLREDRYVAACRRDHPLAKQRSVPWPEFWQYETVGVARESGNRLMLDKALARVPGRPHDVFEAQHLTGVLSLVEAGPGVAAVPALSMPGPEHPLLASVGLHGPVVTRRIGLISRKGRTLEPAARELYELFTSASRDEAPAPVPAGRR